MPPVFPELSIEVADEQGEEDGDQDEDNQDESKKPLIWEDAGNPQCLLTVYNDTLKLLQQLVVSDLLRLTLLNIPPSYSRRRRRRSRCQANSTGL